MATDALSTFAVNGPEPAPWPASILRLVLGHPYDPADWLTVRAEAEAALALGSAVTVWSDSVRLGREPTDAEDQVVDGARRLAATMEEAVARFPVATLGELREKVGFLAEVICDGPDLAEIVSRDLARLIEGEAAE